MSTELKGIIFEENDDFKFYGDLYFEDESERKKLIESLIEYQLFLVNIEVMQDGDEVEDERIMKELFTAIEISKINVEARAMYIRMIDRPRYIKEHYLKELCQEMKEYTGATYKTKKGEFNYLYLRACEYLAEFYLINGLYTKVEDVYKKIDFSLVSFSEEVFEFMLFHKLIASIYTNNQASYGEIHLLATANDIHQTEMISFSEFLYNIMEQNEDYAKHELINLMIKNKFTAYFLDKLEGVQETRYVGINSFYDESKFTCMENIFYYYKDFINNPYYKEQILECYALIKELDIKQEADMNKIEIMKGLPYFKGVSDEDLRKLADEGYTTSDSFLGSTMWEVFVDTGVKLSVLKELEDNGVEFDEDDFGDPHIK